MHDRPLLHSAAFSNSPPEMAAAASGGERKRWEDALPRGQRTRALCIGVNDYTKMDPLANAIADANGIAHCIRDLPESSAYAVQKNPANKRLLKDAVERFLGEIPRERPPRIVRLEGLSRRRFVCRMSCNSCWGLARHCLALRW